MSLLNFFLSKKHEGQAANGKNRKWILFAVGFVTAIAIIIGNLFVPLIERVTVPRPFGVVRKKRKG